MRVQALAQETMCIHLIMSGCVVLCIPSNVTLAVVQFLLDEKARVWESVPEVFSTLMKYHARKVRSTIGIYSTPQKHSTAPRDVHALVYVGYVPPCMCNTDVVGSTGGPGHEYRDGAHHLVLSECRDLLEEGGGGHRAV